MPKYLKKYNQQIEENTNKETNQQGEGALLDLVVKGLSHLLPSLISQFGSEAGKHVGDAVGSIVKDKIKSMKSTDNSGKNGAGVPIDDPMREYTLNRRQKGKNVNPISSYDMVQMFVPSADNKKTKKGGAINVAGSSYVKQPSNKCQNKLSGSGSKLAGSGSKLAGGGSKLAGGMKQMKGSGTVKMVGSGMKLPQRTIKLLKYVNKNDLTDKSPLAIKDSYNKALMKISDTLGTNSETNTDQLNNIAMSLFGNKYGGTLPYDELPHVKNDNKYYIINTHPSYKNGEHWMAVSKNLMYDSFGRTSDDLSKYVPNRKVAQTVNDDRNQSYSEKNCGQRSLAFLVAHALYGDKVGNYL